MLATATDTKTKEESQALRSGKRVAVSTHVCKHPCGCNCTDYTSTHSKIAIILNLYYMYTYETYERTAVLLLQCDWTYNIGENALDLVVFSGANTTTVSIYVLGKRKVLQLCND